MNIWIDGGSRGNPGPAAWAVVSDTGYCEGGFKADATNNEAEYLALFNALLMLLELPEAGAIHTIHSDSLLVVQQVNGRWKQKSKELRPLWAACQDMMRELKGTSLVHVPREQNVEADAKVNQVLDAQKGK